MANPIQNDGVTDADFVLSKTPASGGATVQHAQAPAVVRFGEIFLNPDIEPLMMSYLTPKGVAKLGMTNHQFHNLTQHLLPPGPLDPDADIAPAGAWLKAQLASPNSEVRHEAMAWLVAWADQVDAALGNPEPGEMRTGEMRAAQFLAAQPDYLLEEVDGRVVCPDHLVEAAFAAEHHKVDILARNVVELYARQDNTDTDAIKEAMTKILEDNDLRFYPMNWDTGELRVNERCRRWLWLPTPSSRESGAEFLVKNMFQWKYTGKLIPALATFLRQDPRRDQPDFVDVLANVMNASYDLRQPEFAEALQAQPGGIAPEVVKAAPARLQERTQQRFQELALQERSNLSVVTPTP